MNQNMGFFEQHKALIITSLLFSILILAMYNINISNSNKKVRETLIELNNLRQEAQKQEEEQQKQEPKPASKQPRLQTHQAFNENRAENETNVKSRLDEIFEKNSAKQEAAEDESSNPEKGEYDIAKAPAKKRREASAGNNTSEEISSKEGSYRNSSISFSLMGRRAIFIPNPVYTCDTPGRIVVNIEVNAQGAVVGTSINKSSSTSSNECLIDQALEYASKATFSALPGKMSQPGTITYNFQK